MDSSQVISGGGNLSAGKKRLPTSNFHRLHTTKNQPNKYKNIKELMAALDKEYRASFTTGYEGKLFDRVIDWCRRQKQVLPPAEGIKDEPADDDPSRYRGFGQEFFQILFAASDLRIQKLVDRCCYVLARTIDKCNDTGYIQDLFGIRNDLTLREKAEARYESRWVEDESVLIARASSIKQDILMLQDVWGGFILVKGPKDRSAKESDVRDIWADTNEIKQRSTWRSTAINIEGSATLDRWTAVSLSNGVGERRVVWKSALDATSQRAVTGTVGDRSPNGSLAGFPPELLQSVLDLTHPSRYPMLRRACHLFHSLLQSRVLEALTCLPFNLSEPCFRETGQRSDYVGIPDPQLSSSSITRILSDRQRAQLVRRLVLIGNSRAPDDNPSDDLMAALPNALNLQNLIIKWFKIESLFPKILQLQDLLSLTVPSLRGLVSGSGLQYLKFLRVTSHASGDPAIGHFPNVIALHMTLYNWAMDDSSTAIDGQSMTSLKHLTLDGSAGNLRRTFFNVLPNRFCSLDIDVFRIGHRKIGGFFLELAPRLQYLRMQCFTWPVSVPFTQLEVLEIYRCEMNTLSLSSFPSLTRLRVSDICHFDPMLEMGMIVQNTVEVLVIEQLNPDLRNMLKYIKVDLQTLLDAKRLQRVGFTGLDHVSSIENLIQNGLEVFESKSQGETLDAIDRERRFARRDDKDANLASEGWLGSNSKTFRSRYDISKKLGQGTFGTVHICIEKETRHQYAVKKFKKPTLGPERSKIEGLQQEIAILMSVSHPNIIGFKEAFEESDAVYVIFELAPNGDLHDWIQTKGKLTEDETRKVFVQLFQGVKYLHERNIVHRDIKLENVLLMDDKFSVKLADFGLGKIVNEDSFATGAVGTRGYIPPELLQNKPRIHYTKAVDIWSLGVALYACLSRSFPFSTKWYNGSPYKTNELIKRGQFFYHSSYWFPSNHLACELINGMLTVNVEKRMTIKACLEHPWLSI